MKEQETHADIIAEMRGARTEFPFVYLIGEPDTPEVIDSKTKEIVEPRKINIRRVTVTELADRLEAANRRERGDCAKLREALDESRRIASDLGGCRLNDYWKLNEIVRVCEAALAAPPRNCDRFNTGSPMKDAEDAYGAWERYCDNPTIPPSCKVESAFKQWLFAPATKTEGGNDGN